MGQKMLLDFLKKLRGSIIQHSEYLGTAKNTIFWLVIFGWVGLTQTQGELRWSTLLISFKLSFGSIIWCYFSYTLLQLLSEL